MRKLLTLAIPMLLGVGLLTAAIHRDPQARAVQAPPGGRRRDGVFAARGRRRSRGPHHGHDRRAGDHDHDGRPGTYDDHDARHRHHHDRPAGHPGDVPPAPADDEHDAPAQTQAAAEPTIIDCGTGSANAKANLVNLGGGRYGLTATVINESTKDIELDSLVVTADYGAAGKKQFTVGGRREGVRPGRARPR